MSRPDAEKKRADAEKFRSPLAWLAIGLGHMIALAALIRVLETILGQSPLALALGGAISAELVASNGGVKWLDDDRPSVALAARAALRGVAPVVATVVAVVAIGAALGWADVSVGHPSLTLFFALLRCTAIGVRDELLFRGIPLTAAPRARVPRSAAIAFAAVAGAAALALSPSVTPIAIAVELVSGLAFALLWRFGTAAGVAAHATFALLVGAGLHGSVVDATWKNGELTLGAHADGPPALLAAALLLAFSIAAVRLSARAPGKPAEAAPG